MYRYKDLLVTVSDGRLHASQSTISYIAIAITGKRFYT